MEYIIIHGFYNVIPNLVVRNEPNLDWFQGKYRRSDAENIGSVCLMVREKIGLQTDGRTDGHGDNISVFFPMRKKALKMYDIIIEVNEGHNPTRPRLSGFEIS